MITTSQADRTAIRYFFEVILSASLAVTLVFVCVQVNQPTIQGQALETHPSPTTHPAA